MEVINNSGESKNIGSNNLVLIDSKGRRYETRVDTDQGPSINLSIWVADGFDFGSVVFSNSSIIGAQVFEVPRDSTGLKLEITKEDWVSEDKLIFSLDPVTDIGRDYTIEERLAT